jgi:hypothetical protein
LLVASSPFVGALKHAAQLIMLTFVYSWPAPFWSGAAIGIVLIATRLWRTKAAWQTIRKVTIHHSIPPRVLSQWGYGASLITKGKTVKQG